MEKINLPKNLMAWYYFDYSYEGLIEILALKLSTPREKIELGVIYINLKIGVLRQ